MQWGVYEPSSRLCLGNQQGAADAQCIAALLACWWPWGARTLLTVLAEAQWEG